MNGLMATKALLRDNILILINTGLAKGMPIDVYLARLALRSNH